MNQSKRNEINGQNHSMQNSTQNGFFQKIKNFFSLLKWLDPFHYVDLFLLPKINPKKIQWIEWIVYALTAFFSAFLIYTILGFFWGTASPMVIVYSGSMEPTYYRGDIIALQSLNLKNLSIPEIDTGLDSLKQTSFSEIAVPVYSNDNATIQLRQINFKNGQIAEIKKEGPIIVYYSEYLHKPIIHRAIIALKAKDGIYFLTKGDSIHNNTIDEDCGRIIYGIPEQNCINLYPVPVQKIEGMAFLKIPMIGYVKLFFFDDLPNILTGKA